MSANDNPSLIGRIGPEWNHWPVVTFGGMFDTHIETGEDYDTLSLASIFTMQPESKPKGEGPAFIPSLYCDYGAREHAKQRDKGEYVALTGDIDGGDHTLEQIEKLVRGFVGDSAWLIYSSAHAKPGDMRWRIVIPISRTLRFEHWCDAQNAFFDFMDRADVIMDRALDRAAQPVYLPNVPLTHAKTGDALRGEEGEPLYYARKSSGTNAPGLPLSTGPIAVGVAEIRRKREADERERQRIRAEAEQRRAASPPREGAQIIDEFNRANKIDTLLELYGYERSLRNADDWRSPNQTSGSYATRVFGDHWVSLSGSDTGARIGQTCKAGCYGDAYDLFVHFEHGGDHKSAFRALYSERRASMPAASPPPIDTEDPGWTEEHAQEMGDEDREPIVELPEPAESAAPREIEFVDAFDFDEADIPPRPWLIPGVMLSGYTHMLAAPGGSGKSLFTLQLAMTLAKGEPWGSFRPVRPCKTAIINVEDDLDEQRRRLAAARRVMDYDPQDLRGMIEITPAPENIVVAGRSPDGRTFRTTPIVESLCAYIEERGIDVLIVDPFAETFEGDENDNSEVKWCMKIWRDEIARRTGCVVYLVHHTVKYAGNGAGDANVIRGGGAIVNSTRISATLMPMTQEDAELLGVDQAERHLYVRYDDAKANQSLKTNQARWFQKVGVLLDNGTEDRPGDEVGALVPWTPPDAFDGLSTHTITLILDKIEGGMPDGSRYTLSTRGGSKESGKWAGCLLMDIAELSEAMARKVLAAWRKNGVIVESHYQCPIQRRKKQGLFAPENARPGMPENVR